MPTIPPRWDSQPCDETASATLAAALSIEPAVARLLCQRGLGDPELALRFLNPVLEHLHDPMRLADMRVAVDRLFAAIARRAASAPRIPQSTETMSATPSAWSRSIAAGCRP